MWESDPRNRDRIDGNHPPQGGFRYVGMDPRKLGSICWDVTLSGSRGFLAIHLLRLRGLARKISALA